MKQTILYPQHQALGAKLVPFAGWSMPLHYGSQIKEHLAVRQAAGLFDVSHMQIFELQGQQAQSFLRRVLANDVAKLKPMQALYSCMLNEGGGVIDDLIVYHLDDGHYRLVVNAATADKDWAWLLQQAQSFKVKLRQRRDLGLLALQGPQAVNHLSALADLKPFYARWQGERLIARTGYTGEDGFEIMLPLTEMPGQWSDWMAAGIQPCGLGARDTLRLEAGMNLYGQDMDEDHSPLVSGLDWTVDWQDEQRDFIGRAALQQQKEQVLPAFVGLILQGKGVLRAGQSLFLGQKAVGYITSGGFAPSLNASIALARVQEQAPELEVQIRQKRWPVAIVKPPFIRRGQIVYRGWFDEQRTE